MQLPNLISLGRLGLAPLLLLFAWHDYRRLFLLLAAASFASDVLDGYLARRLGQISELGARLDSVGDFVMYLTLPLGAWWLWPALVRREAIFFWIILGSCVVPPLVAWGKFRRLSSYHTWGAKLAALCIGGSAILFFAGAPVWLFRLAVPIGSMAALEEIVITLILPEYRSNVRSLWHIMRSAETKTGRGGATPRAMEH